MPTPEDRLHAKLRDSVTTAGSKEGVDGADMTQYDNDTDGDQLHTSPPEGGAVEAAALTSAASGSGRSANSLGGGSSSSSSSRAARTPEERLSMKLQAESRHRNSTASADRSLSTAGGGADMTFAFDGQLQNSPREGGVTEVASRSPNSMGGGGGGSSGSRGAQTPEMRLSMKLQDESRRKSSTTSVRSSSPIARAVNSMSVGGSSSAQTPEMRLSVKLQDESRRRSSTASSKDVPVGRKSTEIKSIKEDADAPEAPVVRPGATWVDTVASNDEATDVAGAESGDDAECDADNEQADDTSTYTHKETAVVVIADNNESGPVQNVEAADEAEYDADIEQARGTYTYNETAVATVAANSEAGPVNNAEADDDTQVGVDIMEQANNERDRGSVPVVICTSTGALAAHIVEEVPEATVVGKGTILCMALRAKRTLCGIAAVVILVIIVAVTIGVTVSQSNSQASKAMVKTPITDENIQWAVNEWYLDQELAEQRYGHISSWDTSNVTTMANLFRDKTTFNEDISRWNTSAVQYMENMFLRAKAFTGDISGWDVSSVKSLSGMFNWAISFNGDLSKWNTSNVRDMNIMFMETPSFNGTLCWDLSSIQKIKPHGHAWGQCQFNNKVCQMFCRSGGSFNESCVTNNELIVPSQECPD